MAIHSARKKIERLLNSVDILVNGPRSWDMQVHDERVFSRILGYGSLGAGEAYMDGWWETLALDEFLNRVFSGGIPERLTLNLPTLLLAAKSRLFNMQTVRRSKKVAIEHYNLGNDLYMSFLDPYNQYTCAYFNGTETLNHAQELKLDLICRKLQLSSSDRVLDIGCGWGGFARFASERYGCEVSGVSISDEQITYAREFCKGLPVNILKSDYRDLQGTYDKILICGMIEHVGFRNYTRIIRKVHQLLKDQGLFLLHTIGSNVSHAATDPWMSKYIFPNSMTPSMAQLSKAFEGSFVLEDWQNIGVHYVKTLKAWYQNFDTNWHSIKDRYGDRFYKMWAYYLLGSSAYFSSRNGQLWQMVLSKHGVKGGYEAVR